MVFFAMATYDHAWFADNSRQEAGFLASLMCGAGAGVCGIVAANGPANSRVKPLGVTVLACGFSSVPVVFFLMFAWTFGAGFPPSLEIQGLEDGIGACSGPHLRAQLTSADISGNATQAVAIVLGNEGEAPVEVWRRSTLWVGAAGTNYSSLERAGNQSVLIAPGQSETVSYLLEKSFHDPRWSAYRPPATGWQSFALEYWTEDAKGNERPYRMSCDIAGDGAPEAFVA